MVSFFAQAEGSLNPDPPRELSSVGGTHIGGRGDHHVPRESVGGGSWLGGVAGGEFLDRNGHCNNAGRDHKRGRDKRCRILNALSSVAYRRERPEICPAVRLQRATNQLE
jgi:hypothetical protein